MAGLLIFVVFDGTTSSAASPATTTAETTTEFTFESEVLKNGDFTNPTVGDPGIADPGVVRLADGRVRMYIAGGAGGIRTAVSPDGLTFSAEAESVLPSQSQMPSGVPVYPSQPRPVRLDDGRIRLFFLDSRVSISGTETAIASALCATSGLSCAVEEGYRINSASVGRSYLTVPGIVRLADGRYKAYFTAYSRPPVGFDGQCYSATSVDMLAWNVDAGVRIGADAPNLTGKCVHPGAIANPDGSVTMFYSKEGVISYSPSGMPVSTTGGVFKSTSTDGITFSSEARVIAHSFDASGGVSTWGDPEPFRLSDGRIRVFVSGGYTPAGSRKLADNARIRAYIDNQSAAQTNQPKTKVGVKRTISSSAVAKAAGLVLTKSSRVTLVVASKSKKVCKVEGAVLRGLKRGSCSVTAKVTTGKKTSRKSLIVTVT